MIKLNRTTEYGLMALRHMSRKQREGSARSSVAEVTSAREIAESYGLPFEITAKTLQRLKDTGLIQSAQGARGGYTLQRSLQEVNLAEFLVLMEGPQAVVACASADGSEQKRGSSSQLKVLEDPAKACCEYESKCGIRTVMSDLNGRVLGFLSKIRLAELTESSSWNSVSMGSSVEPRQESQYGSLAQEP